LLVVGIEREEPLLHMCSFPTNLIAKVAPSNLHSSCSNQERRTANPRYLFHFVHSVIFIIGLRSENYWFQCLFLNYSVYDVFKSMLFVASYV